MQTGLVLSPARVTAEGKNRFKLTINKLDFRNQPPAAMDQDVLHIRTSKMASKTNSKLRIYIFAVMKKTRSIWLIGYLWLIILSAIPLISSAEVAHKHSSPIATPSAQEVYSFHSPGHNKHFILSDPGISFQLKEENHIPFLEGLDWIWERGPSLVLNGSHEPGDVHTRLRINNKHCRLLYPFHSIW